MEHTSETYRDLHDAIASVALKESRDGAIIVKSENTGARELWIFDLRALMLQGAWLDRYAEMFWDLYKEKLPFQVGGMETAGIPLVSAIVMKGIERGTPINGFFLRKSRKRQGLMQDVEGTLTDEPIVLVDDLVNSSSTITKQVDILHKRGNRVSDAFVMIAFRDDAAYSALLQKGVALKHLFTLKDFGKPLLRSDGPEVPKESFAQIWKFTSPDPSRHLVVQKSTPLLHKGKLFAGFDDGHFRALDAANGEIVWEFSVGKHPVGKSILSSPTIADDIVYFGAYDGNVYALDTKTGKNIWTYGEADWIGSSPDLAPDLGLLYIGLEFGLFRRRGGIAALDLRTGARRWMAYHADLTHASPLYIREESLVVIGSNDGVLYAYDAKSGQLRWKFATRGDIKTRPAYDPTRRAVIVASLDGIVYSLSARDGTPIFAFEAGPIYSTPLVSGDVAFVSSLDKCVYAIALASGKKIWIFETGGRIFASPMLADSSLWIGSNDGRLYELDPSSGKLLNFFQATERIVNKITYDNDTKNFYVPTQANEIYCLQRAPSERP